jgi:hypothetical protein
MSVLPQSEIDEVVRAVLEADDLATAGRYDAARELLRRRRQRALDAHPSEEWAPQLGVAWDGAIRRFRERLRTGMD